MSVTLNAKGTSISSFKIGKGGTTLYQGSNPYPAVTPKNGDYWLDTANNSLRTWSTAGTAWLAPSLEDVSFDAGTISTSIHDLTLSSAANLYFGSLKWPNSDGAANQVLSTNGAGVLSFTAVTASTVANITGGTAGSVPYQSAPGTTAMTAAGTAGQVLTSNGAAAPAWSTPGLENYFLLMGA